MARELKEGDKVRCCDGSYVFGIKNKRYANGIRTETGDRENLTVLAIDISVKEVRRKCGIEGRPCNTLVGDIFGNYWFIPSDQLSIINSHSITIDDKVIELSEESYQNILASLK